MKLSRAAEAAKAVRKLAKKYDVKLTYCRAAHFAGGSSVDVYYKKNQNPEAVKKFKEAAEVYKAGYFNAMNDIYEYKLLGDHLPRVKYIIMQEDWR